MSRFAFAGKSVFALACLASCGPVAGPHATQPPSTPTSGYALQGGRWFDGVGFRLETVYVVAGRLERRRPARVERAIDISGKYVVPPLGEAHTHTLIDRAERNAEFLADGIFYAQIMNAAREAAAEARARFNLPTSVDVTIAVAGLTASDGHPSQFGPRVLGTDDVRRVDGAWVHLVDDRAQLDAKWTSIRASRTDWVKIFLEGSEDYAARRSDPKVAPRYRGLDPALVPEIVRRARDVGLPVAAHVRTAADFHVAVAAGADQIAHLPGFVIGPTSAAELDDPRLVRELDEPGRFLIAPADAAEAARRGISVHTTASGVAHLPSNPPPPLHALREKTLAVHRSVHQQNLRLLKDAGVRLLLASDAGRRTSLSELMYLASLDVFSTAELVRMAVETTPQAIFPRRRVGRLDDGYEASFLVLDANPLERAENLRAIALRVKDGRELVVSPAHPPSP